MAPGTIQRTITLFRKAFDGLGVKISLIRLEQLAIMVHEAMTVQARHFHTPAHIFDLTDGDDPIQALAALFHDVVYYEVDEGFIPQVEAALAPFIRATEDALWLADEVETFRPGYHLLLDVFGFAPGQALASAWGQNEFLSALLMGIQLADILSRRWLVEIAACIEATIPFRGRNQRGETPAEVLERRLRTVDATYGLGMDTQAIQSAVLRAVVFSNRDVENFSERDTGRFLDNTWKLLPESNPSLRHRGVYAISSYRRALQSMETFLVELEPDAIFNQYRDVPPLGVYEQMRALAHRNVHTARQYLGLKLLAIGILEGLAAITGGDAPVSLFMGAIDQGGSARRLEDHLPDVSTVPSVDESSTLFGLLAFGRASSSSFDMQNSPLSLFLFKTLGMERAQVLLIHAKAMFEGEIDARTFLGRMPTEMIVAIAMACAEMASTRSVSLRAYADARLHRSKDGSAPTLRLTS